MTFIKGVSGNPAGRKKGTKNRTPEALRAFLKDFLFERADDIAEAWGSLDGPQKLMYFDRLCRHVVPTPQDDYLRLSDADFERLLAALKEDFSININN